MSNQTRKSDTEQDVIGPSHGNNDLKETSHTSTDSRTTSSSSSYKTSDEKSRQKGEKEELENINSIHTNKSSNHSNNSDKKQMPKSSASSSAVTQRNTGSARNAPKRKPKATSFHQQTMWAIQPVLSPKWVISTMVILGLIFIPLGVIQIALSKKTQEYRFDYTDCLKAAPADFITVNVKNNENQRLSTPFQWRKVNDTTCEVKFQTLRILNAPVFMYYRLSDFYQNNRLYSRSISYSQLRGNAIDFNTLKSDCDPLVGPTGEKTPDGKDVVYYPCGLIANSLFNDTFSGLKAESNNLYYSFPPRKISWPSDLQFVQPSKYQLDDVRAPPEWRQREDVDPVTGKYRTKLPDLGLDERFLNWIRLSGLPTFRKLYGKYDPGTPGGKGKIPKGTYTIQIKSLYDVQSFGGRKALIISEANWFGGASPALGIVCCAVGGILLLLGLSFLIKHLTNPRLEGDIRYLPWYQPVVERE